MARHESLLKAAAWIVAACIAVSAVLAIFGPAKGAETEWPVAEMNAAINQTNFIVGEGEGHCSGTLVSLEHRLVLTNHHCVSQYVSYRNKEVVSGGKVEVQKVEELADVTVFQRAYADYRSVGESRYRAKIVARWQESDLALLQIYAETLPYTIAAPIFAGDSVMRGETVYVVGNPQMLDTSVTRGIVSSTQRAFVVPWADNQEVPFIQVDSGISGGNSGGALYNTGGELIGVPAARFGDSTLGLAIPFFRVQEFLSANCYGEVWDATAESYDDCMAADGAAASVPTGILDPMTFCGQPLEPSACGLPRFGGKEANRYLRWLGR